MNPDNTTGTQAHAPKRVSSHENGSVSVAKNGAVPNPVGHDNGTAWATRAPAECLRSVPDIRRVSLQPTDLECAAHARKERGRDAAGTHDPHVQRRRAMAPASGRPEWHAAARRRRFVLVVTVLLQTAMATWSLGKTFPYPWLNALEVATVSTFAILFSWISLGFWTSLVGLWVEWRKPRRFISADLDRASTEQQALSARTAILMPICNEEVVRVFAGVETTYLSLAATGQLGSFDFFILSDTSDPDRQVEEELAWAALCRNVQGFGRIFYRHRRNNIKRKSGNIADFLRRWGGDYGYMVVFDADSVMTGEALVRLVQIMDRNPDIGILQTVPTLVRAESLFGRIQQFANRIYGPMLAAGAGFLQLGESYYWGHNAILRVSPFMDDCILPRLSGEPPFGGEILSHDFVEAALMGRAGFEVWIVEDLAGSYEETPPSLQDELKRDRRWCQGNLQHLRLMTARALRTGHRAIFVMGVMTYASALFWFVFLALSSVWTAVNVLIPPVYFSAQRGLFPMWPQWRPEWAIALFSTTALLLFLPKFLCAALIVRRGQAHLFGGLRALSASLFLEVIISALLAPVRMWFHSRFVILTLLGRNIKWGAQSRAGSEMRWSEAVRFHGGSTLFAFVWFSVIASIEPSFAWWLLPVAGPLMFSIPLSVFLSRVELGRRLRSAGLLLTPEEIAPPEVVTNLQAALDQSHVRHDHATFTHLLSDPSAIAVHLALRRGNGAVSSDARLRNGKLVEQVSTHGPQSLTLEEKRRILRDAQTLSLLHRQFAATQLLKFHTTRKTTALPQDPGKAKRDRIVGARTTASRHTEDLAKAVQP